MKLCFLSILISCFFGVISDLCADPPATLSYQGRLLTAQGEKVKVPTNITFRIYDVETGGTKLWEEAFTGVTVTDGIFSLILGNKNPLTALAFDRKYYLGLVVNGGVEMTPRLEMTSAPYAMNTVKQASLGAADTYVKTITMPKNVTISPSGSGQASVTWNAVEGATSYNLYLATESGVNASNYASKANGKAITGVTSPYTITGLTNGTQYFFSMASVTPVGESVASLEVKTTPSAAEVTNTLGMTFKLIPAGTFTMGSPLTETGRQSDEGPQHSVTISKAFYMQTTEVTQGQWQSVMNSNPSGFSICGPNCPVERVSWNDAQTFITKLNAKGEGAYRLPTEAEWEYSARAGTTTPYSFGNSPLGDYAWYENNSSSTTHPVATKLPNPWGLYDMHGNVWEWVEDWFAGYTSSSETDPIGPLSGTTRVFRGGRWYYHTADLRSADRGNNDPNYKGNDQGFRLVKVATTTSTAIPTDGLVAYYPFNGNANDESGNGNNGTVNGQTLTSDRNKIANSAYSFSGSGLNYIAVNSSNLLKFSTNDFSISMWVNNSTTRGEILGKDTWNGDGGTGTAFYFSSGQGRIHFAIRHADRYPADVISSVVEDPETYPLNTWQHFVGVRQGDNLLLYRNGKLSAKSNGASKVDVSNDVKLKFGTMGSRSTPDFKGSIDDIRIYNRALTEADVQQLYAATN